MRKLIATIILMIDSFHHQQINPYVIQHWTTLDNSWIPECEIRVFPHQNLLHFPRKTSFFLLFIISMCLFVCLFPRNITGPTSRIQQFHDVTKFMEEYNILLVVNIYIFYK